VIAAESDPRAGSLWRSALFQTGLVLSVLVWGLLSLFTVVLPYRWRYWFISRWCTWMRFWLLITCGVRVQVEGTENIPDGGGVVLAKHQSVWETVSLTRWFNPQTWVLKRELLWLPVFGWALALLQPIAIDRGSGRHAVRQVIEQGRRRLADGRWVVVFPEGTRVPAGKKARYRPGGAILAAAAGVPVVPVAHNAGELWPRASFRIRAGTVRVRIGPPIDVRERRPEDILNQAETWIEAQMPLISAAGYSGALYERGRR
jgi:1-acyl-sn-glycerol-3-phosphate acyltransferase